MGRMPRPGPRPYECVRRAWHSDRHQPMRGSIIQQIFKVVYENHNSVTKKNKEWQEKLPVVVLKAEEIMYSKANSEAEYMDLGTLWDRVNDAIDTIIRKDETAETGGLLPPCVEAALTLGCVPVRASRSQRHSNPRNYLSPRTQEPASTTSKASPGCRSDTSSSLWSSRSGNQSNLQRVPLVSGDNSQVMPDINLPPSPSLNKTFSPAQNHIAHPSNTPTVGSVYPLYYGTNFQAKISGLDGQAPQSHTEIIIGTPVYASVSKPSEIICTRSTWHSEANETDLNRRNLGGFEENITEKIGPECDLSLRLGLFSDSFHAAQSSAHGSEGGDPRFSEADKTGGLINFFSGK